MIPPLIDAASRSLLLALAVWIGLRIFRVRSVPAEKAAWSAVLAFAILMPLLLPLAPRLPATTVVLPSIVTQQLPAASSTPSASNALNQPAGAAVTAMPTFTAIGRFPAPTVDEIDRASSAQVTPQPVFVTPPFSLLQIASFLYFSIASMLFCRLLAGIISALSLWQASEPVSLRAAHLSGGLRLRYSHAVSSPVTVGSGVILPADYDQWDDEKLRIVLAHERSHVHCGDFYLQTLASLYAVVVWFSPLGWWLKRKLSDLGETISDRSGLKEAASCSSYAQILLEFAAAPRPTLIGVAMARPSTLSRRIERLLNPNAFQQAFSGGRRALLAALLVPTVLFAANALVRVQAASQTLPSTVPTRTQAPITGQSNPDAVPAPTPEPAPTAPANALPSPASGHVDVPAVHVDVPAVQVNVPTVDVNVPAKHIDAPNIHMEIPAIHVNVPGFDVNVPAQHIDVPAIHIDLPATGVQKTSGSNSSPGLNGELLAMFAGSRPMLVQAASSQAASSRTEATFDRTLSVNGKLDLSVATGSGYIHLTRGSGNQVRIHGTVRSRQGEDDTQVRQIAANPPIEQVGNIIRIGSGDQENLHNISIDYQIEAPADAALKAASGSGGITDDGVGQDAKLTTGSGDIVASGLQGGFTTQTGSGKIAVSTAGPGDAKAQTGSGSIDLKGISGALTAHTGSGHIIVAGIPTSEWKLQTGSGSVELSPGNASLTLDASTGSGSITTDHAMAMQVSSDRHHLRGQLNGSGPEVRIETGSGSIHIH